MSSYPGEHPEPHSDLSTRHPHIVTLQAGSLLYRFHRKGREAVFYGRTGSNRFDSPDHSYGVLYAAADIHAAFIESFGQATGIRYLSETFLSERVLTELKLHHPLRLIDLAGKNSLSRIGADARIFSGSHSVAQRWSAALRNHPEKPHGIVYPARHDAARTACALFEGAAELSYRSLGSLMERRNKALLAELLNDYAFGLG